jgi:hypothetical protein
MSTWREPGGLVDDVHRAEPGQSGGEDAGDSGWRFQTKGEGELVEWADRIGRLNSAINAEVDDLMDIIECCRGGGPHVEIVRVADGLIVLGEHLRETAADLLDVGSSARQLCQAATEAGGLTEFRATARCIG